MHDEEKSECWQGPHWMAWRVGLWPAGRLLHTPALDLQQKLNTFLRSSQKQLAMRSFLGIYSAFV